MQSIKNLNFIFIPNSTEYEINLDNKTITQHLKNPEIEFNLASIAAILTIAGYSINDTVVVFDRIRENLVKSEKENRDKIDTQRKESPLEPAHDSIQINSDDMNIDEVIELMLNNIEKNK